MANPSRESENTPAMQKLMDSPFLLLAAGLIVMFVFYTIWGLIEILTLPQAQLP
ncbi:MAG: hypothetical protein AAB425_04770 [Bdellovibrionota bacterium]